MVHVLIVEDATLQQMIIRRFIQPEHTVVGVCATESKAVELADKHEPDAVVMDINLAEGDGIQAAKRIKATDSEIRIIMSTAVVSDEIKELTQGIPVDSYLTKPYSKAELLEAIKDTVE